MVADQNTALGQRLRDDKRDRLKQLRAFDYAVHLKNIALTAAGQDGAHPLSASRCARTTLAARELERDSARRCMSSGR